jgi:hypothetical protein
MLPIENAIRPGGALVAPAAGSAATAARANPRTVRRRTNLLNLYPALHREPGRRSSASASVLHVKTERGTETEAMLAALESSEVRSPS